MPLPWPDLPRSRIRYTHTTRDRTSVDVRNGKELEARHPLGRCTSLKTSSRGVCLSTYGPAENSQCGALRETSIRRERSHWVVVGLEEFAHSIDGFGVHRKPTEKVNEILVAHACLDQLKCTLLQRRVHSIGQTATCKTASSTTVGRNLTNKRTWLRP